MWVRLFRGRVAMKNVTNVSSLLILSQKSAQAISLAAFLRFTKDKKETLKIKHIMDHFAHVHRWPFQTRRRQQVERENSYKLDFMLEFVRDVQYFTFAGEHRKGFFYFKKMRSLWVSKGAIWITFEEWELSALTVASHERLKASIWIFIAFSVLEAANKLREIFLPLKKYTHT